MKVLHIENRVAKVKLNDAVTPWSADDLIADIEKAYGQAAVAQNMTVGGFMASASDALETLEIEINSPGGSVLDGYRIYNSILAMKSRGVRVVATVNTLAASMGSVILMAADEAKIMEGGRIMIHEASQTISGDSSDHARAAKILDEMSEEIAAIYAKRTGKDAADMRALMKAETWMGAKESLERGFVDEIVSFDTKPKSMGILSTLFPGNDQVAKFEAQVAENDSLRSELATAQAKIHELSGLSQIIAGREADISAYVSKVKVLESEVAEAKAKADEFAAKITELEAANVVSAERISLEAARQLAASGHPEPLPVNADEKPKGNSKQATRAEFNAMTPRQKSDFSKAGGRISD